MVSLVKENGITPLKTAIWTNPFSSYALRPGGGMADTSGSKPDAERYAGSNPAQGTKSCSDSSVGRAPV